MTYLGVILDQKLLWELSGALGPPGLGGGPWHPHDRGRVRQKNTGGFCCKACRKFIPSSGGTYCPKHN